MLDLLIRNATLPDGRTHMSVAVQDGRITAVEPGLDAGATVRLPNRRRRLTWVKHSCSASSPASSMHSSP